MGIRLDEIGEDGVNSVCHACTGFAGQACERLLTHFVIEAQDERSLGECRAIWQLACLPRSGASMAPFDTPSHQNQLDQSEAPGLAVARNSIETFWSGLFGAAEPVFLAPQNPPEIGAVS